MGEATGSLAYDETVFMSDDVVMDIWHVSKKFCRHLRRSMAYGLVELGANMVGIRMRRESLRREEFWAIDDVSFTLRRGEALGVVGLNGSGKTTLLRLLAGNFPPDKGEIRSKGRICTLISIGAGFHPHLTGRENVYLNASILGISGEEIDACFEDIAAFAEIGDFMDSPVSIYSSGMRIRLGFAIATSVQPDILLLDEVFAVGDVVFRQRCFERMGELLADTAIILVSNRTTYIESLCTRSLWLHKGSIVAEGAVDEVVQSYMEETNRRSLRFARNSAANRKGNGALRFTEHVRAYGPTSGDHKILQRGERLVIEAPFECHRPAQAVRFTIDVHHAISRRGIATASCEVAEVASSGTLHGTFTKLPLKPGGYIIKLKTEDAAQVLDSWSYATDVLVIEVPLKQKEASAEIYVDLDETASEVPDLVEPQGEASIKVVKR